MASYWPLVILYSSGLMGAANQYVGSTDNASLLSPVYFWQFVLGPVPLSILAAIGVALGWNCFLRKRVVFTVVPSNALLIGAWLCVLPVFVMLGGRYVTHAYEHRYAITAVIGAAMLIGAGFDLLRSAIPGAAGLAILALILPVSIDAVAGRSRVRGRHIDYGWSQQTLAEPTLPIIYSGPLESVQAWFNAPSPELKRRITCLVDVKEASQRMGSGAGDLGVINLKPALGLPAQGYREFTQQRKAFYLIHQPAMTTWVTKKLVEDGAELKLKGLFGPDELYLVTWRPGETGPSHQLRQ